MKFSAEQILLRWRPTLRQADGFDNRRFTAQVCQYLLDHHWVFDSSDDFHAAAADAARFDVDIEHPLQALRPAHRCMACNRRCVFSSGCLRLMTSAPPRWRHPRAMLTVGCEHAVIARQIHPRFRHQRRQPRDEVQGLENDMGGAVTIRGLQLIAHLALRGQCQALLRNRGSGDITTQALQLVALIGPGGNASVQVEPGNLAHGSAVHFIGVDRRQCLQGKDLAPGLRPQRNAIGNRMPLQHTERIVSRSIQLEKNISRVPKDSLTHKAINYTLNQWDYLSGYCEDGKLRISNALAENAIRPFAVGRRNWLFSDTPRGARASATCYSLIETAKANGLEPYEYIRYVLQHIASAKTVEDIEALLPWNVSL